MLSSIDDDKSLKKLLRYLYDRALEHTYNNFSAEELTQPTKLTLRQVKEQGNRAILNGWVIVDARDDAGEWIIRINDSGINKLKELENIEKKSKLEQTSKIGRFKKSRNIFGHSVPEYWIVIGTLATIILGSYFLWLPFIQCQFEVGENGLIYTNCPLNFQISRPSQDWSFVKDMTYVSNELRLISPSSFLGGIIVQSPENQVVSLWVLDGNDPQFSDLNQFANLQVERFKEKAEAGKYQILPSFDKNSVLVEADGNFTDQIQFSLKEKIKRHDNKIYILTTGFVSDHPLSKKELDGLEKTYESFGHLR